MKIDQKLEIDKLLQLPVVERPRRIAELVHRIQVDKAQKPYIDHPRRVAENVQHASGFEQLPQQDQHDLIAAAWLHDVVEDSGDQAWPEVTLADLADWGINERVIEIVDLLTRKAEVPDNAYYEKIKANSLARRVKLADITDNANKQRILWVEDAGVSRNATRYVHALEVFELTEDERNHFAYRVDAPAVLGTINDERLLKFGARGDGPGEYRALFCMDGALSQWWFDHQRQGWSPTFRMLDLMIKGDFDFDIIPLALAKRDFPRAFPMVQLEGDPND